VGKDLSVISEENIVATPESILGQGYEIYQSSNIDIMITRDPIHICSYEHAHEGYEFFIPILFVPKLINVKIDSTTIQPTPGSLIPANPGQTHGFEGELTIYN
jgi:hypothetical protein